jgi:excinuclease UvrABC nuclease subunit
VLLFPLSYGYNLTTKSFEMTKENLKKLTLPDSPGVYFFLGKRKEILYIGKATSLRNRVRSYFDPAIKEKRSALIEQMVEESKNLEWQETDSVLEAMLLEVNLIRTHKPRCNTKAKDDKSYNHLLITNEAYPRVLVVRGKDITDFEESEILHLFGPFPNASLFREALKLIKRLFQFYDTKHSITGKVSKLERGKIDFNRQIGLFPGETSAREYRKTIRHIVLLFEGKKEKIITDLEKLMHRAAKSEDFETARHYRDRIKALQHIQDVSLIKDESREYRDERNMRIEAYDVAHLDGDSMVGVMTVVRGGQKEPSEYRKFKINGFTDSDDPGALREILSRRLTHTEWPFPDLIVVDGSTAQKNAALKVLKSYDLIIPVVGVVKDERHKPLRLIGSLTHIREHEPAILLANGEAHRFAIMYHKKKRNEAFMKQAR